jgi:hypothetical protein
MSQDSRGWIGVDLDGTLAVHGDGDFHIEKIGAPIYPMLNQVKRMLYEGCRVKIFTARADHAGAIKAIEAWCQEHIGTVLEVTNVKDRWCELIYDDRAVSVEFNVGTMVGFRVR